MKMGISSNQKFRFHNAVYNLSKKSMNTIKNKKIALYFQYA